MINSIVVENLRKSYGNNQVIKDLSLEVHEGEIFGLLGVNGAGKTTLLECIEGLKKYDSGNISVNGNIGVQLQISSLPPNIKVIEAITLVGLWNSDTRISNDDYKLSSIQHKQYKDLSTGQKRRLHLAMALIGNPDIIILDEPTAGLDIQSRIELHSRIRELKSFGKTIVIASHDMAEVESLCDRIGVLQNGDLIFQGTVNQFTTNREDNYVFNILLSDDVDLSNLKKSTYMGIKDRYRSFSSSNIKHSLSELLNEIGDIDILDMSIEKSTLEQVLIDTLKEVNNE